MIGQATITTGGSTPLLEDLSGPMLSSLLTFLLRSRCCNLLRLLEGVVFLRSSWFSVRLGASGIGQYDLQKFISFTLTDVLNGYLVLFSAWFDILRKDLSQNLLVWRRFSN